MSPQIIPHFTGATSGGITWDANLIARNPYVIGLEGCVFRRVVDTVADLANISNPQLNDRALVWGADSSETKIYQWDGTWGDMGQPLSNVQYVDSYSHETLQFYKIEPDTNYFSLFSDNGFDAIISVITLPVNYYLLGGIKSYNSEGLPGALYYTKSTSMAISKIDLITVPTDYIVPIKCNGISIWTANGRTTYIGFKAASN